MTGAGLLEVDDALFSVGDEGGFFDDVVEGFGIFDFFEGEGGVGFVSCDECDGADAGDAVEE